jgi:hypothetical protein
MRPVRMMHDKDSAIIAQTAHRLRMVWVSTMTNEMDGSQAHAHWCAPEAPTRLRYSC